MRILPDNFHKSVSLIRLTHCALTTSFNIIYISHEFIRIVFVLMATSNLVLLASVGAGSGFTQFYFQKIQPKRGGGNVTTWHLACPTYVAIVSS